MANKDKNIADLLKLGVMAEPTSGKYRFTFGADPVSDTDSGSFPISLAILECGILGDLLTFLIPLYSHWPLYTKLGEMSDADKVMNPLHFGNDQPDVRIRIQISQIRIRIADQVWLRHPKIKRSAALGVGGGISCQSAIRQLI